MACKHLLLSLSHNMNQHDWYIHQYPDPSSASLPFFGPAPTPECPPCGEGPKTELSVQVTSMSYFSLLT